MYRKIYPCPASCGWLLFWWFADVFQLQAVAGLAADGRQIVARAKSEASNYERFALCSRMFKYGHISLSIIFFISLFSY